MPNSPQQYMPKMLEDVRPWQALSEGALKEAADLGVVGDDWRTFTGEEYDMLAKERPVATVAGEALPMTAAAILGTIFARGVPKQMTTNLLKTLYKGTPSVKNTRLMQSLAKQYNDGGLATTVGTGALLGGAYGGLHREMDAPEGAAFGALGASTGNILGEWLKSLFTQPAQVLYREARDEIANKVWPKVKAQIANADLKNPPEFRNFADLPDHPHPARTYIGGQGTKEQKERADEELGLMQALLAGGRGSQDALNDSVDRQVHKIMRRPEWQRLLRPHTSPAVNAVNPYMSPLGFTISTQSPTLPEELYEREVLRAEGGRVDYLGQP